LKTVPTLGTPWGEQVRVTLKHGWFFSISSVVWKFPKKEEKGQLKLTMVNTLATVKIVKFCFSRQLPQNEPGSFWGQLPLNKNFRFSGGMYSP